MVIMRFAYFANVFSVISIINYVNVIDDKKRHLLKTINSSISITSSFFGQQYIYCVIDCISVLMNNVIIITIYEH